MIANISWLYKNYH